MTYSYKLGVHTQTRENEVVSEARFDYTHYTLTTTTQKCTTTHTRLLFLPLIEVATFLE